MKASSIYVVVLLCAVIPQSLVAGEIHRSNTGRQKYSHASKHTGRDGYTETLMPEYNNVTMLWGHTQETWVYSIFSAILVGLSGIFPLLVIPLEAGKALRKGAPAAHLRLLLSFAVGGLLGDVFLHLLPEAWCHLKKDGHDHGGHITVGLWVLAGLLSFLCVEKVFPDAGDEEESEDQEDVKTEGSGENTVKNKPTEQTNNKQNGHAVGLKNGYKKNGFIKHNCDNNNDKHIKNRKKEKKAVDSNGVSNGVCREAEVAKSHHDEGAVTDLKHIKTTGWLNLMANVIDNFTHGLAVAGSYCAGTKVGMVTTFAILVHEIPHEIGDFAILLRSGFDRWKAAKAQLLTASGGVIGALTALISESAKAAGDRTAWVLPFTSGGFIYIALVTVVPDLLKENRPRESFKQMVCLCAGIASMGIVTLLVEE